MSNFAEDAFGFNQIYEKVRDCNVDNDKARVLLLYTGGTIGMKQVNGGYTVILFYYRTVTLSFCFITVLLRCHSVLLQYSYAVILFYYSTVTL